MTRRALIVGISNYGHGLPSLESPDREVQEWRDLLVDTYEFQPGNIRLLVNERARKDAIESRLDWLLEGAAPGDQLVFYYAGHGARLRQRVEGTGELLDNLDEALIAYPGAGEGMEEFAIYDDDLVARFVGSKVPAGTDVTVIFDCCHGGGINLSDLPRRPRVMSVTPPIDLQHRSLGWSSPSPSWRDSAVPMIVNAAGELNLSVELDLGGACRSLFSYHALNALRRDRTLSHQKLIDQIREPMREHFAQHPNLRGNVRRRNNPFLS